MKRISALVVGLALSADIALAEGFFGIATVSDTVGSQPSRLCVAAQSDPHVQIACPSTAPSLTIATGDVSFTGAISADAFYGDGSGLTNVGTGDRITSGTTSVVANTTGSISFTTGGSTAMVISGSNVGIGTSTPDGKLGIVDAWNSGGTTFTTIKVSVTDIASAGGSLLMDLHAGGISQFKVGKNARVGFTATMGNNTLMYGSQNGGLFFGNSVGSLYGGFNSAGVLHLGGSTDVGLSRLAPSTIALGNGNNGNFSGTLIVGNVGIGNTVPAATLQVSGSFIVSTTGQNTSPSLYVGTNGNVGIGTSSPSQLFQVGSSFNVNSTGSIVGTSAYLAGSNINSQGMSVLPSGRIGWTPLNWFDAPDVGLSRGSVGKLYVGNGTVGDHTGSLIAGNLGIGTAAPGNSLTVVGDVSATTYYGDGSQLTGISTESDRITSGTTSVVANNSGPISFTTAAGTAMVISGSNVGIGTATPSEALEINGSIKWGGALKSNSSILLDLDDDSNDSSNGLYVRNGSNSNLFFVSENTGNVGIGTTAPAAMLDVSGTIRGTNLQLSGTVPGIYLGENGGTDSDYSITKQYGNLNITGGKSENGLTLRGGNGNSFVAVTATSRVGVGTTAPAETLDVSGTAHVSSDTTVSGTVHATAFVGDGSQLTGIGAGDRITSGTTSVVANNSGPISFTTAAGTAMVISGSNVGIGTASSATKLVVRGPYVSGGRGQISIEDSAGTGLASQHALSFFDNAGVVQAQVYKEATSGALIISNANASATQGIKFTTVGSDRMVVSAAGNVGISTASPSRTLHVNGTAKINSDTEVVGTVSATEVKVASAGNDCTTDTYGTIRWNATMERFELCGP